MNLIHTLGEKILAFAAHPDDIEYSCYGLLSKIKRERNAEIHIYIASLGSERDPTSGWHRIEEAREALKPLAPIIHLSQKPYLNHYAYDDFSDELRALILKISPQTVLVHDANDTHQEHQLLSNAVNTATRRLAIDVLKYKSLSSTVHFQPNVFVDITGQIEEKFNSLMKHVSQSHHDYFSREYFNAFHLHWTAYIRGMPFVEQYFCESIFLT